MDPMVILLLVLVVAVAAVVFFFGYLIYVNGRNTGKTSAELKEKESELIELYSSLELMIKEIDVYTQKAKSEINADIDRIKKIHGDTPRQNQDIDEKLQYANRLYRRNEDMDYADKCRLVRLYHEKSYTVPEISRTIGLGQGEVKLILDLKKII